MKAPRVAVIVFPGTNSERETVDACRDAGMDAQLFHWSQDPKQLRTFDAFVLPGGSRLNTELHACRTICRRAERLAVRLAREEETPPEAVQYLNRLSDAFFVWSRWANHKLGVPEVLWEPNKAASGQ